MALPWEEYQNAPKPWEEYAQKPGKGVRKRSPDDLRLMAREYASKHPVTDDMNTAQRFGAGVGKSLVDTWQGLQQMGAAVGDYIAPRQQDIGGLVSGKDNSRLAGVTREVDARRRIDAPLMDTGAGVLGDISGQVGQVLTPLTDAAKLVSYSGRGAPLLKSALQQGAFGFTQPVASDQSRLQNGATAALFGLGGQMLTSGTGALAAGARSQLSKPLAQLAQKAEAFGIPLGVPQISNNSLLRTAASQMERLPFSGGRKMAEQRQDAFTKAVGDTFDAQSSKLTPDVFKQAKDALGNEFETISGRNVLPPSPPLLSELGAITKEADALAGTDNARIVKNWVEKELLGKVDANGVIPGKAYQSFDSRIGKAMKSGDGEKAHYLGMVRDAVRSAMDDAISPADKEAWQAARRKWANLKTVEPLVAKSAAGEISPAALMGRVTADGAGKSRMAVGNGGQLGDLARIGQRFLKESPNSGTADRLLVNSLLGGGLFAAQGTGLIDPETALITGGLLAGNRLGVKALNSKALVSGNSKALKGLARATKPAPRLLPAAFPLLWGEDY